MMKTYIKFVSSLMPLLLLLLAACKKEAAINPKGIEELYIMKEGTTSADSFRYKFFMKYGTKILFEYDRNLYYYTPTSTMDTSDKIRYITDLSQHVQALRFINHQWLRFYPADFKEKFLPLYILLADRLVDHINIPSSTADSIKYAKSNGFSSILIAGLGNRFDTMSLAVKNRLRNEIHLQYLYSFLWQGGKISLPEAFFEPSVLKYFTARATPRQSDLSDYGPAGFVKYGVAGNPTAFPTRAEDLQLFLRFIIEVNQADVDAYINVAAHASVKLKYNLLVNFFNNLGIDLRSIHATDPAELGTLIIF